MNQLPDIVIIDFCDWLYEKTRNNSQHFNMPLDIIMNDDSALLESYAKRFLVQRNKRQDCPIRHYVESFFTSREFRQIISKCDRTCRISLSNCNASKKALDCCISCRYRHDIRIAFLEYIEEVNPSTNSFIMYDVSYRDLADNVRRLFSHDSNIEDPDLYMHLMVNMKSDIEIELDFLEWLLSNTNDPASIRKMPSNVFEHIVDEYIEHNQKEQIVKKQLMKAYRQTGLDEMLERIQVLFRLGKKKRTKTLEKVLSRYLNHLVRYNCIILPLSDTESQKNYKQLITDSWSDLNALSRDYLDIYYSESDKGKSGFEIARKLNSLPTELETEAPCIVIWEDFIKDAKIIPLFDLNNKQVFLVIKCIVKEIQKGHDFETIVKEASKMVEKIQNDKNASSINYYVSNVGNMSGDNTNAHVNINIGEGHLSAENLFENKELLDEFQKAIEEIKQAIELNEDQKASMISIMEEAMSATIENSSEKARIAKTKFDTVKSFIVKSAPTLISVLSNLANIATFFGIHLIA